MDDRHNEVDVAHSLTADFLFGDFYTTAITNDAFVANALVFATVTLVVLDRAKNALAEKAITFRLVRAIVDGLRLQYFTV